MNNSRKWGLHKLSFVFFLFFLLFLLSPNLVFAATPAITTDQTQLTLTATMNTIGVELVFTGDDNANAKVTVQFKKTSDTDWRQGLDLWRTDMPSSSSFATDQKKAFYGSLLQLDPNTNYDITFTVTDPDGGSTTFNTSFQTKADNIPTIDSVWQQTSPTLQYYVNSQGSDTNDGKSSSSPWQTLEKALSAAPSGAVVQVGPGYYKNPTTKRTTPLTLFAQYPATANKVTINNGLHSVIDSEVISGPATSTTSGVVKTPWVQVTVTGPGYTGAPIGAQYNIWKWANTGVTNPYQLGYAATRDALPKRVAKWEAKGSDLQTVEGWAEKLYTNKTYNYGYIVFPNSTDIYLRLEKDINPNTMYITVGGGTGLYFNGPNQRISGFEIRDFIAGIRIDSNATNAIIDHNIISGSYEDISIRANKFSTPQAYSVGDVIEQNIITDQSMWTNTPTTSLAIPWNFIKKYITNADGTLYLQNKLGFTSETNGIGGAGFGNQIVIRNNKIDGTFNGISTYNEGFDRYAAKDIDIYNNNIRHIADDAIEPEFTGINWRIWNNKVEQTFTFLSTGPVNYGPIYVFRNTQWKGGDVQNDMYGQGLVFKYSGQSLIPARVYVVNNTFWTDAYNSAANKGISGGDLVATGGTATENFYMKNNIFRMTRYAFVAPGTNRWNDDGNIFSTNDLEHQSATDPILKRGFMYGGRNYYTNVSSYQTAYQQITGNTTTTNILWNAQTGQGNFLDYQTVDANLNNPLTNSNLYLKSGSLYIDKGSMVPNIADVKGNNYRGCAPDLGATETFENTGCF